MCMHVSVPHRLFFLDMIVGPQPKGGREGGRAGGWEGRRAGGSLPLCIEMRRTVVMYCLTVGAYNLMRWQLWSGCISHGMGA